MTMQTTQSTLLDGVQDARVSLARAVVLAGLAVWEALLLLWVALCSVLVLVGVGAPMLVDALAAVRAESVRQRRLALEYSGVLAEREDPPWPPRRSGFRGWASSLRELLTDGRTWYDLLWHLVNPVVGGAIACAPLALVLFGLWGVSLPLLWEPVVRHWDNSWYALVPLNGFGSTLVSAVVGVLVVVAGVRLCEPFLRLHGRWVRASLTRVPAGALQDRVDRLTDSRADVVEMQASELRRIERDLHDGAQARLVAMGMNLSAAERLIGQDPEAARDLLRGMRSSSSEALAELRNLVRGIHPPILADRGLTEAVRALALDCPIDVTVSSTTTRRLPLPLESALYFAVSELLLNAVKHAGASHVSVVITDDDAMIRIQVQDDGRGGADPTRGSGLRGIERRLAAFDGSLEMGDPAGPTTSATVSAPVT